MPGTLRRTIQLLLISPAYASVMISFDVMTVNTHVCNVAAFMAPFVEVV